MLFLALGLFLLAVVFGLVILTAILQERPTHKIARFAHGAIALTALGLLVSYVMLYGGSTLLLTSVILLSLAALGGLTLLLLDLKKKSVPKWLAVIHPIIAMAGLIVLIIDVLP